MTDVSTSAAQPVFPRIKEPAPYFEARTTHGVRKLTDYAGKWLVLFSHPADFTPVPHRIHCICPGLPRFPEAQLRPSGTIDR